MIQHDKRWMEASDAMPMFPSLVWKIQLEAGLRDSLNAGITAALAELRRELGRCRSARAGSQGTSCICAPSFARS